MPLTIPENAPFSGPQRMWLKGFLDGLNNMLDAGADVPSGDAPAATTAHRTPVIILWGSQTGNAESLAKKLAKKLGAGGFATQVVDMAATTPAEVAAHSTLLVITSTYGDGEPPDNAAAFYQALHAAAAPPFGATRYAVLALGDSNYEGFCKCGVDIDRRLAALGATPLTPIVTCDVDFDEPYTKWSDQLMTTLAPA